MSEGNVYLSRWENREDRYVVWLEKHPNIRAHGTSMDDAIRELGDLVCLKLGDGEAMFEFEPPLEQAQGATFVSLGYNSGCRKDPGFTLEDYARLWEGGICEDCCRGIGPRTEKPFPMGSPSGDDVQSAGPFSFSGILLASKQFQQLLSPDERTALIWRPVEKRSKTRRNFFEIVPRSLLPQVIDREKPVVGWRCGKCGNAVFGNSGVFYPIVSADDLPKPPPDLLTVAGSVVPEIVVPRTRWRAIRGQTGARGIVTHPVTVLPAYRASHEPELQLLTKEDATHIRRELRWQFTGSWD
jgi:hypothetical protein